MKFLLKTVRIEIRRIENTVPVGRPSAPIALDCYSTVICARCHPRSEETGEKREALANVATRERTARTITWRCSDCIATVRCASAFIMHIHPHISRWYTLKRHEHTHTSIRLTSADDAAAFRNNKKARVLVYRTHKCENCSRAIDIYSPRMLSTINRTRRNTRTNMLDIKKDQI